MADECEATGDGNAPDEMDRAEVGKLVAELSEPMAAYLRRRAPRSLLDKESAADLAQSVCREALDSYRRGALEYRGEAQLRGWLYGAADMKLKNRLRHYGALKRGDEAPGELDDVSGDVPTPSTDATRREQQRLLWEALDDLDDRAKKAVTMFHFEGHSHEEVAEALGLTASHSRTIVARGLARLAKMVRGRLQE